MDNLPTLEEWLRNNRTNELEAVVRDAMRYRWLRGNSLYVEPGCREGPEHPILCFHFDTYAENKGSHNAEGLDAAIDAQMGVDKFGD